LLASYDRLALLKESVESALRQDFDDYEVLVIDDGSNQETRTWLAAAEAKYPQLRVVYGAHAGIGAARNTGVMEARSEFICILDSDDILVPYALQRLSDEFESNPALAICHCNIKEQQPNGISSVLCYPGYDRSQQMLRATLWRPRVPFKHSGTMFRRDIAIALGSYDPSLPSKIDIDFYLKFLSAGYKPQLVPEALVSFRMHKNSVSRNRLRGLRVWFQLIDRYGPPSLPIRLSFKLLRCGSEIFKWIYISIFG
jgi:glycosyltransferase involved in cell wall biosynthesis